MRVLEGNARDLVTFDPMIVRGFDYYTSTVFEVFDTSPENRRSLFGGGRYANLVELFCAAEIPGSGFGMGDVTLMDFLDTHGLLPTPRSEVDVAVRKLGKELARTSKAGGRVAVIIGPAGWAAGTVTIRDMVTGDQHQTSTAAARSMVTKILD